MKKYMHDFRVLRNKRLTSAYFVLYLECPEKLPSILPGQFAEVLVENSPSTYLRRPFSIYNVDYDQNLLTMLIKEVGEGTRALGKLEPGDKLNIIYPLGNSFSDPPQGKSLLIGGGVGIAPMFMLAKHLVSSGRALDILIGGRGLDGILEPVLYEPFGWVFIPRRERKPLKSS